MSYWSELPINVAKEIMHLKRLYEIEERRRKLFVDVNIEVLLKTSALHSWMNKHWLDLNARRAWYQQWAYRRGEDGCWSLDLVAHIDAPCRRHSFTCRCNEYRLIQKRGALQRDVWKSHVCPEEDEESETI